MTVESLRNRNDSTFYHKTAKLLQFNKNTKLFTKLTQVQSCHYISYNYSFGFDKHYTFTTFCTVCYSDNIKGNIFQLYEHAAL